MRSMLSTVLCVATAACSSHSNHAGVDAIDSPTTTTTLTIHSYRASGPVNTQLVAVQDGDGPWTVLAGTAGVYTTAIHGDRYGVMTSCTSTMYGGGTTIWYAVVADGTTLYVDDCQDPGPAAANISGSVTGVASGDAAAVLDAYFDEADLSAGTTAYTMSTVAGAERLIAEDLVDMRPVKLATVDATVTDGAMINFDLGTGFTAVTHALSADQPIAAASLSYRDAHGIARVDLAAAPFDTFRAIPSDKLGSGLDRLLVSDAAGGNVIRYFANPIDQHITFPTAFQLAQSPTASATPYPNVKFVVPVRDGNVYDLGYSTTNMTTNRTHSVSIEMTSAWIAAMFPGAASFDYAVPDFHALPGWTSDFQPEAGLPLDWSVAATKYIGVDWYPTVPPGVMFDHDGSELQDAPEVTGQLPAP